MIAEWEKTGGWTPCCKELCAFWNEDKGECLIVSMSKAIVSVAGHVDTINDRLDFEAAVNLYK